MSDKIETVRPSVTAVPTSTESFHVIEIHFDGGADPNPGRGYGSYEVICATVRELNHKQVRQQFGEYLTNNQAEYMALRAALKWMMHKTDDPDMRTHLKIYSDSKLVVMQVAGWWKRKCLHIRELRDEVCGLLACYDRWEIHWNTREKNMKRFGH